MKKFHKTITVFLFAISSAALADQAVTAPAENVKTQVMTETEQDDEIEYYDYHSGTTYTYSLFNFIYKQLDRNATQQDKIHKESTGY